MEINTFNALIPIDEYLVDNTLQVGDVILVDGIVNLQNITNTMIIGIARMKPITIIEILHEGLLALSTYPVNKDIRSITKIATNGMFIAYVRKKCQLAGTVTPYVTQGNLFAE